MKSIVTLIATLVAASAFATEAVKAAPAVAASAPVAVVAPAPAKCDPAKDKTCKVEAKAVVAAPAKSTAPAVKVEKAATPAAPASK